jgi:hypothetical protein
MPKKTSQTVKVKVLSALVEDGERYEKNATFDTSPERAAALGGLVQILDAAPEEPEQPQE